MKKLTIYVELYEDIPVSDFEQMLLENGIEDLDCSYEILEESYKREAYDGQSFYKAIKNDFITAYCAAYGCSKREAEQTYKDCVREGASGLRYMQAVVDDFKDNAKRTFYDD